MKVLLELRVLRRHLARLFTPDEGDLLGLTVFKVVIPADDPRVAQAVELQRELVSRGDHLFTWWRYYRRYSKAELQTAALFLFRPTAMFEPPAEECGTQYDYSNACGLCGSLREVTGQVFLDLSRVPRSNDVAVSIARDELFVSQAFAELLVDHNLSGCELRPVAQRGAGEDGSPSRWSSETRNRDKLLAAANAANLSPSDWRFFVWLNRAGQTDLRRELGVAVPSRSGGAQSPRYLLIPRSTVEVSEKTTFGEWPLDGPEGNSCPLGHIKGIALNSELVIRRSSWDGSDIARSNLFIGVRRGLLAPFPLLVISQRCRTLLEAQHLKGYELEIARMDDD